MEYFEFEKSLKKDPLKPIYVLFGKEPFLRQEGIEAVKKRCGESTFYKEYSKETFQMHVFMSDLCSDALFDDLSLLIVKNADSLLETLNKTLTEYLQTPNDKAVIVLEMEKWDNRTKLAKSVASKGYCVDCKPLYDRPKPWLKSSPWETELVKWVINRSQVYQKKINPEAAFLLTEYVGNNLKDIDSQLQKIAVFVKERKDISTIDIEKLVYTSKKISVFDFLDSVCSKDLKMTMKISRQIFKNGIQGQDGEAIFDDTHIALQLTKLLHFRMKQMWKIVVDKDLSDIPEFFQKKLQDYALNFSESKLILFWQMLLKTEFLLKTSQIEPEQGIENLIYSVC